VSLDPTLEPETPDSDAEDPQSSSLAGWKVLVALLVLGVVTGGFLALFGHSLSLFG
jgi:hypothetical protein